MPTPLGADPWRGTRAGKKEKALAAIYEKSSSVLPHGRQNLSPEKFRLVIRYPPTFCQGRGRKFIKEEKRIKWYNCVKSPAEEEVL
jgi:hypothetical protein